MPTVLDTPLRRALLVLAVLIWLGTAYAPVLGAAFHGHDLELLVRAGQWSETEDGFGPRAIGDFEPIEVLDVVGDDARGDVGSLLSGLWMVLSLRLWGAVDGRPLGLPSPFFYRLENLALLLIASWGLWRFLARLFSPWVGGVQAGRGAFAAALMFAVHPLCVPTVASLGGRSDLMSLAFATWAASAFVYGRQERQYALLVVAGMFTLLAGFSGQIALALPPALAAAEFLSCGRQRPIATRVRTAFNTLLVYSALVQLNVALVSTTTGHGYYPRVSYSLAGLLEPGAIVAAMGNVLSKIGVLCLPANSQSLGALGVVLALVLFLAALQPALVAARSAPRLWTATFLWWGMATLFALLFGLQKPVDLGTMGDAVSLVPATLVLCAGLGLACTALTGLRRLALPLALSFGYASLANGNGQPWGAAAGAFADLRRDVVAALEEHPEARRVVIVDAPRSVLGVDGVEDGLRWVAHPMFTGEEVRSADDLGPLAIHDVPRDVFATWVRSGSFGDALDGSTLLVVPDALGSVEGEDESAEPGHSGRLLEAGRVGVAPTTWVDDPSSPELDLDAFGPAVLDLRGPESDAFGAGEDGEPESLPEALEWRGFGEHRSSVGSVPVLWFDDGERLRGLADGGSQLDWRLAGRVARVWFESGLTRLGEARVVDALPEPNTGEPVLGGSAWRFAAPAHPLLERLEEGVWVLRAVGLDSLEHRSGTARTGRAGSPLAFRGFGRWSQALLERGEPIAWELEYRVDDLPALRRRGTVVPEGESTVR